MRKQSAFMAQLNAQVKRLCNLQRSFTIQQMEDMALITLESWLEEQAPGIELTPDRAADYRNAYRNTLLDYAEVAIEDDAKTGNNDPQLNYTKGKIDQALQRILGPHFEPWEDRYTMM